jgi:hypothetical protein
LVFCMYPPVTPTPSVLFIVISLSDCYTVRARRPPADCCVCTVGRAHRTSGTAGCRCKSFRSTSFTWIVIRELKFRRVTRPLKASVTAMSPVVERADSAMSYEGFQGREWCSESSSRCCQRRRDHQMENGARLQCISSLP